MKTILVTMNYNGNMQKKLNVPEAWTKSQIQKALEKKYGIYDIKNWIILEPETTT
jgi:hypothetical protein